MSVLLVQVATGEEWRWETVTVWIHHRVILVHLSKSGRTLLKNIKIDKYLVVLIIRFLENELPKKYFKIKNITSKSNKTSQACITKTVIVPRLAYNDILKIFPCNDVVLSQAQIDYTK